MFTSEEPTRFGISCLGSRAMAGALKPATLVDVLDDTELNFMQAAVAAGSHPEPTPEATIAAVAARAAHIAHFVELHIEQGQPSTCVITASLCLLAAAGNASTHACKCMRLFRLLSAANICACPFTLEVTIDSSRTVTPGCYFATQIACRVARQEVVAVTAATSSPRTQHVKPIGGQLGCPLWCHRPIGKLRVTLRQGCRARARGCGAGHWSGHLDCRTVRPPHRASWGRRPRRLAAHAPQVRPHGTCDGSAEVRCCMEGVYW